ncbi:MAG: Lrp/AsnC family transcriptional regulator [Nitrososphaerota archaeon]|nr:Lrp/AsnC family transcriptional regulator [Nitrososphaerota archaeon]
MTVACMLVRTERGKFDQVAKNLRSIPEVKRVFAVLGRFDVVVELEGANIKQVARAVIKANKQAGVVYTETLPEVEV